MSVVQECLFGSPSYFCERCGRALSNPISQLAHRGPICRHKGKDRDMSNTSKPTDVYINEPIENGIVLGRVPFGDGFGCATNIPHLVTHHSPTGFEFGYGGSGPADLALNVCELMLNRLGYHGERMKCWEDDCFELAWRLHQDFKREFIASADTDGEVIPYAAVVQWFQSKLQEREGV